MAAHLVGHASAAGRRLPHPRRPRRTGAIIAIAPLMRETARMYGVPVATPRAAAQRSHAADRLHRRRRADEAYRAIWNALARRRRQLGCPAADAAAPRLDDGRRDVAARGRARVWRPAPGGAATLRTWSWPAPGTSTSASLSGEVPLEHPESHVAADADRRAGARSARDRGRRSRPRATTPAARGVGLEGRGRHVDLLGPGGASLLHAAGRAGGRSAAGCGCCS